MAFLENTDSFSSLTQYICSSVLTALSFPIHLSTVYRLQAGGKREPYTGKSALLWQAQRGQGNVGTQYFLVCQLQCSSPKSQDLGFGMTDVLGLRVCPSLELCGPYHKILALIFTFFSPLAPGKKILLLGFQGGPRC